MHQFRLKSRVPGFVWPAVPDVPGAMLLAWLYQFEQSQWWSTSQLQSLQFEQLDSVVRHAQETTPYYQHTLDAARLGALTHWTPDNWLNVPLLPRDALTNHFQDLVSRADLSQHGETFEKSTSGSTGQQIRIIDTDANNLLWLATTMRDHVWHRRDFSGHFVTIRSGRYAKDPCEVEQAPYWGIPASYVVDTGPATNFFHLMPIDQQADLLVQLEPAYLLAYPSNVLSLTRYFESQAMSLPSLKGVITYGELLLPEVRADVARVWNTSVVDMYSCEEAGYIALQCPDSEVYHCQSESVLVEVLRDDGTPCVPGEVGRVVLTSLHNFAMPLIRYENRDYAEVASACPCGRGGLTLKRIVGRERNRVLIGKGHKKWTTINRADWTQAVEGVQELQLIQDAADHIQANTVRSEPLSGLEQQRLSQLLNEKLGGSFRYTYAHRGEIVRHANGKYERFIRRYDG